MTSVLIRNTLTLAMLASISVLSAMEVKAEPYVITLSNSYNAEHAEERSNREALDAFRIDDSVDPDGPEQDPIYSEDDPQWDEIDNSVNEEEEID